MFVSIVICTLALSGVLSQGPQPGPKVTVKDQKGEKGGSIAIAFTIEKADKDLDMDQVHIVKATPDHKFSDTRFKVDLSGDSSKITGEASADNLTCDDVSGYIVYYQRIPPPPRKGPPQGSFLLEIEGCPKPEPPHMEKKRGGPPKPDPMITVDETVEASKGETLTFSFSLESKDKTLEEDKVFMVKAGEDPKKTTPVRFTLSYEVSSDGKSISGSAVAEDVTCDDQGGYLIYYERMPPPPHRRQMRKKGKAGPPKPPPGGFMIKVKGCSQ